MKCKKCNRISHDYHQLCPKCGADLQGARKDLGIYYSEPGPHSLDALFTQSSSQFRAVGAAAASKQKGPEKGQDGVDLDLDNDEDFDFTLD